jgi:saccharopine dehydrogenase-like NADP-dependent oxidoreductase
MKVLILGGAGLMAEATERDLLEIDSDEVSQITIVDSHSERLKTRVDELGSDRVSSSVMDLSNEEAVVKAMERQDVVINAATGATTLAAAKASLKAGVNFIGLVTVDLPGSAPGAPLDDIGLPTDAFKEKLDDDFKKAGLTAILGLGSMPGTSNVMGRFFADKMESVESMEFSYAYAHLAKTKSLFSFSPLGMIGQYTNEPVVLRDGKLVRISPRSGRETVRYPEPIGMREVFNILHEEPICFARSMKDKGLKHAGTKAGWGPDLLSKLALFDSLGLLDLTPRKVDDVSIVPARVLASGLTFEKVIPKDYGCTQLIIRGESEGQKIEYTAEILSRPYKTLNGTQYRTGIPAAIGARLLARCEITRKGAFTPEYGINPAIYFSELKKRNLEMSYTVKYLV